MSHEFTDRSDNTPSDEDVLASLDFTPESDPLTNLRDAIRGKVYLLETLGIAPNLEKVELQHVPFGPSGDFIFNCDLEANSDGTYSGTLSYYRFGDTDDKAIDGFVKLRRSLEDGQWCTSDQKAKGASLSDRELLEKLSQLWPNAYDSSRIHMSLYLPREQLARELYEIITTQLAAYASGVVTTRTYHYFDIDVNSAVGTVAQTNNIWLETKEERFRGDDGVMCDGDQLISLRRTGETEIDAVPAIVTLEAAVDRAGFIALEASRALTDLEKPPVSGSGVKSYSASKPIGIQDMDATLAHLDASLTTLCESKLPERNLD